MLHYPKVVVVTGSSSGIGLEVVKQFLRICDNCTVYGIDLKESSLNDEYLYDRSNNIDSYGNRYIHYVADVSKMSSLPEIKNVDILINNAGIQDGKRGDVIRTNLQGVINCTEKYGIQPSIKSILNMASVSAWNGAEFPEYCASKGGVISYTINTAKKIAKYGATCNSLSCGGVITPLNNEVMNDKKKWNKIMSMTPLNKWATSEEIALWVYFLTVMNESCTGEDIRIDNGEFFNHTFVW